MRLLLLIALTAMAAFIFSPSPPLLMYILIHLLALCGIVGLAFLVIMWGRLNA